MNRRLGLGYDLIAAFRSGISRAKIAAREARRQPRYPRPGRFPGRIAASHARGMICPCDATRYIGPRFPLFRPSTRQMTASLAHPIIIQGGMGVGVSDWVLAKAVS